MAILSKIEMMIENPEMIRPENLGQLLNEMLRSFEELKRLVESNDETVREEALEMISGLREKIEAKVQELCQSIGMDSKTLEKYISDSSHFNQDDWDSLQQTKSEIADFNIEIEAISQSDISSDKKKSKPKSKKLIGNLI